VKITPALPNPHPPSVGQDKGGVAAVRPPKQVRDAADQAAHRQQPLRPVDPTERERLVAAAADLLYRRPDASSRASRALAAYAAIADDGERRGLHDLLGFDAYV
jgi:acyl-CoA reductase-like NAD-dependent aldehyde dehydrogenase